MDCRTSGARPVRSMTLLIACLVASAAAIAAAQTATPEWPQWRGPFNTGMARGEAPLRWDDTTNIRWKTAIRRARALHTRHCRQSPVSDDGGADRARDAAVRAAGVPAVAPTPVSSIDSRSSPSIEAREGSPGSGPRRPPRRTRVTTASTAALRPTRRSPTVRASSRSSVRAASMPTTSRARCCGRRTSA